VLPDGASELVVGPPAAGPGAWAGAPCAVRDGDRVVLAYRLRRPVGDGRGYANVVATSDDGVHLTTVGVLEKERFDTDSLERPALVRTPNGAWRLYASLATPGTKHWQVVLLEADRLEDLVHAPARSVLPGDAQHAVKDPVLLHAHGRWHLWASVHPLDDPDATDRMTTDYAVSDDGVRWQWQGTVLTGRSGAWDARGVRVSSVRQDGDGVLSVTYDGRATAAQNWEEWTGTAHGRLQADGTFGTLTPDDEPLLRSPHGGGGLRYVTRLDLPDGRVQLWYEWTRPDGAHELRTGVVEQG
jgi:hypothetical protein